MKRVLALLGVLFMAGAVACAQGYVFGIEIIPHTFGSSTLGITYVGGGYDAGWGRTRVLLDSPFTPLDSWWLLSFEGAYSFSENVRVLGGLCFWPLIEDFQVTDARWSFSLGGLISWPNLDPGVNVFLKGHLPLQIDPTAPLFGAWITAGIEIFPWSGKPK